MLDRPSQVPQDLLELSHKVTLTHHGTGFVERGLSSHEYQPTRRNARHMRVANGFLQPGRIDQIERDVNLLGHGPN